MFGRHERWFTERRVLALKKGEEKLGGQGGTRSWEP